MATACGWDAVIAARTDFFLHRAGEEFYDFEKDPDALHNLLDAPKYSRQIDALRAEMEAWMRRTGDPALNAFRRRQDPQAREAFMREMDKTLGSCGSAD